MNHPHMCVVVVASSKDLNTWYTTSRDVKRGKSLLKTYEQVNQNNVCAKDGLGLYMYGTQQLTEDLALSSSDEELEERAKQIKTLIS
jgi:hypothetical protein